MLWTHLLTCKLHPSPTTYTCSQPCHVTVKACLLTWVLCYSATMWQSRHTSSHTCGISAGAIWAHLFAHVSCFPALPLGSLFACKAFPSSPVWWHGYDCSGICHVTAQSCFSLGTPVWMSAMQMSLHVGLDTPSHIPAVSQGCRVLTGVSLLCACCLPGPEHGNLYLPVQGCSR